MGFIQKSVQGEQNFGFDLKELRELRGWSQNQLSKVSGIPEYIIDALEKEKFSTLNDPFYSERHVRVLVTSLEGRIPFFVGKYKVALQRDGYDIKNGAHNYSFTHKIKKSEFFTTTKYLPFLLLIPIFALLTFYVWNEAKIFRESPPLTVITPIDNEIILSPRLIINGNTDSNATIAVNGISAVVENDGSFTLSMDVPRGLTQLDITAKRRYGLEKSITRYVTYMPIHGPSPPDETIRYYQTFSTSSATTTFE
jgi:Glucodextranase, domain B/Helix-turn-helix domain